MKDALSEMAIILKQINFYIRVEGYTDNVPVTNGKFSSNWQLSAMRAANVVEYLVDVGHVDGERLSGVGYGEYKPIASNDTKDGKAMNRRIDIIILNAEVMKSSNSIMLYRNLTLKRKVVTNHMDC